MERGQIEKKKSFLEKISLYLVGKCFYSCSKANRQNVKISYTRLKKNIYVFLYIA